MRHALSISSNVKQMLGFTIRNRHTRTLRRIGWERGVEDGCSSMSVVSVEFKKRTVRSGVPIKIKNLLRSNFKIKFQYFQK